MSHAVYFVLRIAFFCARANTSLTKSLIIGSDVALEVYSSLRSLPSATSRDRLTSSVDTLNARWLTGACWQVGFLSSYTIQGCEDGYVENKTRAT